MLPKRLLALTLFAALAVMHAGALRAQWVQTNGPYGVWPSVLGVMDSTVFAGNTSLYSIAALTSGVKTWKSTNFPLPSNRSVTAMASIGSKLLVGVDSIYTGSIGNSIYRSTDNGLHWKLSSTGVTDNSVMCFAVNNAFIFAGSYENGVFRSSDSGSTWAPVNNALGDFAYIISLVAIHGYVFVATEGGAIFRSSDNGSNWTEVDSTLPYRGNALPTIVYSDSGNSLLASIYSEGIFSSTDIGVSWHSANNGLTDSNVNKIARCGAKLIAATNGGIFVSSDDGGTWVSSNKGLPNSIVGDLVIRDSTLFISTVNGIFCSIDTGQHWTEIDSGLRNYIQTKVLLKDGQNLFAGTYSGIYLSKDSGFSWVQRNRGLSDVGITALTILHSSSGPILFAGTASGPFRSTDYGDSWSLVDSGFPNVPSSSPEVLSFATIDTFLYAASWYGDLVRSTDYGTTWRILGTPVSSLFLNLISNGKILFAGGIYNLTSSVFFSPHSGLNWQISTIAPGGYDYQVNALAIDTDDLGSIRLYVDAYGDSFGGNAMSMDLGSSWEPFNAGLDSLDKVSIAWFDVNGPFLFCGCPHGFYFSSEKRESWTKFNQGLHDSDVYTIASTNSNIFIGTNSGVWRRPLSEMIVASSVSKKLPLQTGAFAYPNPFSQSTTITFATDAADYADVSIVNLLGAEVAHLFSGAVGVGEQHFTWDAANMAAPRGMYECVVRINGRVKTLPVVVVRYLSPNNRSEPLRFMIELHWV